MLNGWLQIRAEHRRRDRERREADHTQLLGALSAMVQYAGALMHALPAERHELLREFRTKSAIAELLEPEGAVAKAAAAFATQAKGVPYKEEFGHPPEVVYEDLVAAARKAAAKALRPS